MKITKELQSYHFFLIKTSLNNAIIKYKRVQKFKDSGFWTKDVLFEDDYYFFYFFWKHLKGIHRLFFSLYNILHTFLYDWYDADPFEDKNFDQSSLIFFIAISIFLDIFYFKLLSPLENIRPHGQIRDNAKSILKYNEEFLLNRYYEVLLLDDEWLQKVQSLLLFLWKLEESLKEFN